MEKPPRGRVEHAFIASVIGASLLLALVAAPSNAVPAEPLATGATIGLPAPASVPLELLDRPREPWSASAASVASGQAPTSTPTLVVSKLLCSGPPVPVTAAPWVPATLCPNAAASGPAGNGQFVYFLHTFANIPFPGQTYAFAVQDFPPQGLQFI